METRAHRTGSAGSVRRRVLITGIPGTGKTTIGAFLALRHGFVHLDFELLRDGGRISAGETGLLAELRRVEQTRADIVVSWGFLPETQLGHVLELRERGYEWIWLDGDREAARVAFLRRGTSSEADLELQLRAIDTLVDLDRLRPRIVDPFTRTGAFRPRSEIADEILGDRGGASSSSPT